METITKKRITRKVLAVLLVMALMVSMIPMTADSVHAATIVSQLDFTKDDAAASGSGYTWNKDTMTLTLNGLELNVASATGSGNYAFRISDGTTIKLEGSNSITTSKTFAVVCYGSFVIEGPGSLTVTNPAEMTQGAGILLSAEGPANLHIKGGTVDVKATGTNSKGFYAWGGPNSYTQDNGTVSFEGTDYGMFSHSDLPLKTTFNKGTLTAIGNGECAITAAPALPASYSWKTAKANGYIGSSSQIYTWADTQKYISFNAGAEDDDKSDIPAKGTKFTSGKQAYKITDARTNGKGTVAITGFAKGKSSKTLSIGKTVRYQGYTYKITSVAKNAFNKNKKITTVKLGNNIKTIGSGAFYKATKLKKVTIGTGLTKIGKHAFCQDTKLRTIMIKSKKLKSVGKHSLYKTSDLKIKVPKANVKKYTKLFKNKGQKNKANVKVVKN